MRHATLFTRFVVGSVDVIDQIDRDTYKMSVKIPTASGARTGLFVPELNSLFVAVPQQEKQTRIAESSGQRRRESAFHAAMKIGSK